MTLARVGLAFNPTNPAAVELRERALAWCRLRKLDVWAEPAAEYDRVMAELSTTDLLVVLGGDGTFLRAARAVAGIDVPILGVNLGKIGFLSKIEEHELESVLAQVAAGEYRIDERMTISATILPGGRSEPDGHFTALNDVVVARGRLARVCRFDVTVGSSHLATIIADGLIVATPTGSTGYSFSSGGPIVDPLSRNLIVTPIAAYLAAIRSVVVSPKQVVRCRVVAATEALLSVDGREDVALNVGDIVEVRAVERPLRLVEPRGALPFWDLVRHKVELLPS
jgi:NAD+ kinase